MSETSRHTGKRDDLLVVAAARGLGIKECAAESGFSDRHVSRKLNNEAFKSRVTRVRGMIVGRAAGQLAGAAQEAIKALQDLLEAESESVRHAAAKTILESVLKYRDADELSDRVATLESMLEEQRR
jgi:hypothetical protein